MSTIKPPASGTAQYNTAIEDLAARGARAIQKIPEADQSALIDAMPGTAKAIGQSFHGRLLRRNVADLTTLIAKTHFDTTSDTANRVGDLRIAVTDGQFGPIVDSLAAIVKSAEVPPGIFQKVVEKLELIRDHAAAKQLPMIPKPIALKLDDLANGDIKQLIAQVADELSHYAYTPLRRAVDAPTE